MDKEEFTLKESANYLNIPQKYFYNYVFYSREMKGKKIGARWFFKKSELDKWKKLKDERTIVLTLKEYEECFELAIKMAYTGTGHHGTGIRGVRSEMQTADDWILGILAEYALQRFLKEKLNQEIKLDTEAHPDRITPQDIEAVLRNKEWVESRVKVAVKASKFKSCYLVVPPLEYENEKRKSDVYIFVRVGLPSDHLFRILRDHSFFKNVKEFLEKDDRFRKIEKLENIPIWITGFVEHNDLEKYSEIPGQVFDGWRYVKSVADLRNSDSDWKEFIEML